MPSPLRQGSAALGAVLLLLAAPPGAAEVLPATLSANGDSSIDGLWREGLALEEREELVASSAFYVTIARLVPESSYIRWRVSRNYWRFGERLPQEEKRGRMQYFGMAEQWADAGLELDPKCGECVMWKLASLGRVATTGGVVQAAHTAPRIAELIERGIALQPTHRDGDDNTTLGNLYYAGSAFYRIVPDWFWLSWVIGVRGDKHRALDYIGKALEITPSRIDYQVELGAVLLCLGDAERDEARIEEGRRVLDVAMRGVKLQSTDALDLEHARILYEQPSRACGYSRDGWIDLSEAAEKP